MFQTKTKQFLKARISWFSSCVKDKLIWGGIRCTFRQMWVINPPCSIKVINFCIPFFLELFYLQSPFYHRWRTRNDRQSKSTFSGREAKGLSRHLKIVFLSNWVGFFIWYYHLPSYFQSDIMSQSGSSPFTWSSESLSSASLLFLSMSCSTSPR